LKWSVSLESTVDFLSSTMSRWFFVVHGCRLNRWLSEAGWRLFDIEYGRGLPYDLREGLALNRSSFYVLEEEWSKKGAQEFPFGVVVVDEATVDDVLSESSVFYVGGPPENTLVAFLTR